MNPPGTREDLGSDRRRPRRSARRRAHIRRQRTAVAFLLTTTVVVVVVVVLSVAGHGGRSRAAAPSHGRRPRAAAGRQGSTHEKVATHGGAVSAVTYRIRKATLTFEEPATTSIATGQSRAGQPIRLLSTVIRYPIAPASTGGSASTPADSGAGRFPLIVFSQGYDIAAEAYSPLLTAWAKAGYVVADPTYPLTDPSAPSGVNEADIINHPTDLRFVISALLAAGQDPHSPLHSLLDPNQVAVIGHSDGGDVSLAVAANSCCRDPAVKAAVILSGAELSAFGGRYYSSGSVPLLAVQGSADTINVPGCSAQLYDQAPAPKYYLDISGAEHEPPYLDPGPIRSDVARAVTFFLDAYLKHEPSQLVALSGGRLRAGETITSIAALSAGTYCPGAP